MYLSDIKFINLEASKWNKEKSKPRDGVYDFNEKVEVDYRGTGKARESKWFFTWCRYDPRNNYQELREWKIMFGSSGFTPVNVDTDHYWPEPLAPDESGNYVFGDLILVKCRLIDYLKDKLERKKRARSNIGRAKLDKFQEQMEKHGASIPASMFDELMPK